MSLKDRIPESRFLISTDKELTTLFTGRHCIYLDEVDSTNSWLGSYISNNFLPEGSVVRAFQQKKGRGQHGAEWISEPGKNLIQSFLFNPSFIRPKDIFLLNKTFALGVFDFISIHLGSNTTIKWPNDIFFNDQKISGILIENSIVGERLTSTILGIGINVNQKIFPKGLEKAASFSTIYMREYIIDKLFVSLCGYLERRYLSLKRGEIKRIEQDYLNALFGLGKKREFMSKGVQFKGIIRGVDEIGKLIIEKLNGSTVLFDIKEITFLFNNENIV